MSTELETWVWREDASALQLAATAQRILGQELILRSPDLIDLRMAEGGIEMAVPDLAQFARNLTRVESYHVFACAEPSVLERLESLQFSVETQRYQFNRVRPNGLRAYDHRIFRIERGEYAVPSAVVCKEQPSPTWGPEAAALSRGGIERYQLKREHGVELAAAWRTGSLKGLGFLPPSRQHPPKSGPFRMELSRARLQLDVLTGIYPDEPAAVGLARAFANPLFRDILMDGASIDLDLSTDNPSRLHVTSAAEDDLAELRLLALGIMPLQNGKDRLEPAAPAWAALRRDARRLLGSNFISGTRASRRTWTHTDIRYNRIAAGSLSGFCEVVTKLRSLEPTSALSRSLSESDYGRTLAEDRPDHASALTRFARDFFGTGQESQPIAAQERAIEGVASELATSLTSPTGEASPWMDAAARAGRWRTAPDVFPKFRSQVGAPSVLEVSETRSNASLTTWRWMMPLGTTVKEIRTMYFNDKGALWDSCTWGEEAHD